MALTMDDPVYPSKRSQSVSTVLDRPREDPGHDRETSGLETLVHKVRRNQQDYGWTITFRKVVAYLLRFVYFHQVYRIYRIDVRKCSSPQEQETHNFTFKMLAPQDARLIAQIESIAEWLRGKLKEDIAAGHPCLVALDGDKVAGFNLINPDHATLVLVNLTKKLHRGCAWSEHIAVKKEYRKAGLGAKLRNIIFQELRSRGFHRLYGGTLQSNTASLSLARSVGFKEIADVHYRKLLSFEKWRYKRVRA